VLGKLELLIEFGYRLIDKWFVVVCDNTLSYTIPTNDVCLDKINHVLVLNFSYAPVPADLEK